MVLNVIGFQRISYTNQSGRLINGLRIYGTFDDDRITGSGAREVYLSGLDVSAPGIGDDIIVLYDQRGRASGWIPASAVAG